MRPAPGPVSLPQDAVNVGLHAKLKSNMRRCHPERAAGSWPRSGYRYNINSGGRY